MRVIVRLLLPRCLLMAMSTGWCLFFFLLFSLLSCEQIFAMEYRSPAVMYDGKEKESKSQRKKKIRRTSIDWVQKDPLLKATKKIFFRLDELYKQIVIKVEQLDDARDYGQEAEEGAVDYFPRVYLRNIRYYRASNVDCGDCMVEKHGLS